MMLKIDAYAVANAVMVSRERMFPKKQYKELGLKAKIEKRAEKLKRKNNILTMPFTGNIDIRTNVMAYRFKETKLFFPKTIQVEISEIVISLDNNQFSFYTASNPKTLCLYVANEDVQKFDMIINCMEKDVTIDMAQYIHESNMAVFDFAMVL